MAQLENRNISLQELHQSTYLERDSWSTIRAKERIIAWMTADYHRDAGNRQLVLRRCYDLTAQIRQLSDAIAMGNASTHQLLKRQLADKDNEIRRHLRITRMSPVVSEFQRLSPFLVVAAMLGKLVSWCSSNYSPILFVPGQPMPGLTAAELSAFRSASETLRQAGLGIFGDRGGRNPPPATPAAPVSPALPSPRRRQVSPTSQASSRLSSSSSDDFGRRRARSPSVSRSSTNHSALSVSARGSQSVPSSPTRNAVVRRPRSSSVACSGAKRRHSPDSDTDSSGTAMTSGHASSRSSTSSRSRKKARATPTPSPARPGSVADLASANASVPSSALAEDLEGADSSGVESSSTSRQTEAASTLTSLSGATKSVVIRALPPGKHPAWGPSDSDSDGGDSTGGGSAATPPNFSNRLVESSDLSGDESTPASSSKPKLQASSTAGFGSPPLASTTVAVRPPQVATSAPVSATAKAPVWSKTPPPWSPVHSATSTSKSSSASKANAVVPARSAKDASKAKSPVSIRSANSGSKPKSASKPSASKAKLTVSDTKARAKSDGGVPPHHVDVKVLVARAAASARLDSRESGPMKRLRELPFFRKGPKRCWEKIMSSCAVSVIMEKTADGERIKRTPCIIAGLAAFMDFDDSGHPWRSVLRLLPHSLFFVDDSVLEVCPPVEKGKRSKKPGSLLEVLSHEWCKSRGVVREDILLALWERVYWIVESSVNIWLAEGFLASERTSRIDYEFTALWKSLKDYLLGRKQRLDLLRLTVCFDPANSFCPPVNLPGFPKTADWITEAVRIDNHEPWRLWWLTAPGRHPYNTIFRLYHPKFPLFVPEGADSEMVAACVEDERLIAEPDPPALHPNTPAPVNRPGEIEFCPPNIVRSA
ncbi:unnamed protein product [Phytophthora fragariaefolia]|uniref:Unnamed protein product n=1 Tax=Phytophthora fragariaefolia TaxID=1490495 RepID=A0A9W6U3Y0_9STRA|nr:unnamed protein product [Phytophthora fragariaefolia]